VGEAAGAAISVGVAVRNTLIGFQVGSNIITNVDNTALGSGALAQCISDNNTAIGSGSLGSLTAGTNNIALGLLALNDITTNSDNIGIGNNVIVGGDGNVMIGNGAGQINNNSVGIGYQVLSMSEADGQVAIGYQALVNDTVGNNTAVGFQSMMNNSESFNSTACGYQTLFNLIGDASGENFTSDNTALGYQALFSTRFSGGNTALGSQCMQNTLDGDGNVGVGYQCMQNGFYNTCVAVGAQSQLNAQGSDNVTVGFQSMYNNIGNQNSCLGSQTLFNASTADDNTAIGYQALVTNETGSQNTALGSGSLLSAVGNNNIAIGYLSGLNITNTDNNIIIGNQGGIGDSDTIRIGTTSTSCYVQGIYNQIATFPGLPVLIGPDGKLGTMTVPNKDDLMDIDNEHNKNVIKNLKPKISVRGQQYCFLNNSENIPCQYIPMILTKEVQRLSEIVERLELKK
jgi:hypothetical protein